MKKYLLISLIFLMTDAYSVLPRALDFGPDDASQEAQQSEYEFEEIVYSPDVSTFDLEENNFPPITGKENEPIEYSVEDELLGSSVSSSSKYKKSLFVIDRYQKPVLPTFRKWHFDQLMKNPVIEQANEYAIFVAFQDISKMMEVYEKKSWIVDARDDRGFFPIFTAIDHCWYGGAIPLFKSMVNKNPKCKGQNLVQFTQKRLDKESDLVKKERYEQMIQFFKENVVAEKQYSSKEEFRVQSKRRQKSSVKHKKSIPRACKNKGKNKQKKTVCSGSKLYLDLDT